MKYLLILIFTLACSSNPHRLSDEGKLVKTIESRKVPSNCEFISDVSAESDQGIKRLATNIARNKAANLSATHIFIKDVVSNGKKINVYAQAYECN